MNADERLLKLQAGREKVIFEHLLLIILVKLSLMSLC